MVDYTELAILDCLTHPKYGIISHQPDIHEDIKDEVYIRDVHGKLFMVLASECEWALADKTRKYWKTANWKFLKQTTIKEVNTRLVDLKQQ